MRKLRLFMGDLHGNTMKLISSLFHWDVISLSDTSPNAGHGVFGTGFFSLLNKYDRCKSNPANLELLRAFNRYVTNHIKRGSSMGRFEEIVLLGDTVGDRGANDYLTLHVLKHLNDLNIKISIIVSNHDYDGFIRRIGSISGSQERPRCKPSKSSDSLFKIYEHLSQDEKTQLECNIHNFMSLLKLYHPILPEKSGPVVWPSHAPLGQQVMDEILGDIYCQIPSSMKNGRLYSLRKIDKQFSGILQSKWMNPTELQKSIDGLSIPLKDLIWTRYNRTTKKTQLAEMKNGTKVTKEDDLFNALSSGMLVVCGHNGKDDFELHEGTAVFCFDEKVGKGKDNELEVMRKNSKAGCLCLDTDNRLAEKTMQNAFLTDERYQVLEDRIREISRANSPKPKKSPQVKTAERSPSPNSPMDVGKLSAGRMQSSKRRRSAFSKGKANRSVKRSRRVCLFGKPTDTTNTKESKGAEVSTPDSAGPI